MTVGANHATRSVGEPNPAFTISYAGFVGTDNAEVLDAPPIASSSADARSLPGLYAIELVGGTDDNYTFNLIPGELTITGAVVVQEGAIMSPANNAKDVALPVFLMAKPNKAVGQFTFQVSTQPDFESFVEKVGGYKQWFPEVEYDKTYFVRVKTNLSPAFGPVTRFTTGKPEQFTYLHWPTPTSNGISLAPKLICSSVVGATQYTIEINTAQDFSGVSQSKQGGRSQYFTGLMLATTYYVRVRTDLSPAWGPTRSFHTGGSSDLCIVTSPADHATNVSWLPTVTLRNLGIQVYTVQLSRTADFSVTVEATGPTNKLKIGTSLEFDARYFVRAKCGGGLWGPVTTFTTGNAIDYAFVVSPKDGSTDVNHRLTVLCNQVPGATSYTLALSTDSGFPTGMVIEKTGPSHVIPLLLLPGTTYYCRVRTNLSAGWGVVQRFTTAAVALALKEEAGEASRSVLDESPEPNAGEGASEGREWAVYPNPFSGTFSLRRLPGKSARASVRIVDMAGKVVFAGEADHARVLQLGADWAPGVYVVSMTTAGGHTVRRVVKY